MPLYRRGAEPLLRLEGAFLAGMVIVWVVLVAWHPHAALVDDISRFSELGNADGSPYHSFTVEYPPLAYLFIRLIAGASVATVAVRVAILNAVATVGSWWIVRSRWSSHAGSFFLGFALPLQLFMPFRLDAAAVLVTVAAVALADDGHDISSGTAFALAILFRIWPAVLLPGMWLRGRGRAVVVAIAISIFGVIAWVAIYGLDSVRQVASYRAASGWHIESIYGIVVASLDGLDLRFEAGAQRTGNAAAWQILTIQAISIAFIALIWTRASGDGGDKMGRPALATVASLIVLSPVSSPQYVIWLVPWAAVACVERPSRDVTILMAYLCVLTSATFLGYWGLEDPRFIVVMATARAVCLAGLVWVGAFKQQRYASRRPLVDSVNL